MIEEGKIPKIAIDLELGDVEGIGSTTVKKMNEAGINSVTDLAVCNSEELSDSIGCSKDSATSFIMAAQKLLRETNVIDNEFITAKESLENRKKVVRWDTGSKMLNDLLLGGIESKAITEFYGEFGTSKTQICHTVAVLATEKTNIIYLDTEGTFRPERIEQIARERGMNPEDVLSKIFLNKIYTSGEMEYIIRNLGESINKYKVKIVIIDSIISLHRADFTGMGTLAPRQQSLNRLLHRLVRIAEIFDIAVIITNQVQSNPGIMFGNPTTHTGGHVLGHAATYRLVLRKSGKDIIARVEDSPYHPKIEARYRITEVGVTDIEEEMKKKK